MAGEYGAIIGYWVDACSVGFDCDWGVCVGLQLVDRWDE